MKHGRRVVAIEAFDVLVADCEGLIRASTIRRLTRLIDSDILDAHEVTALFNTTTPDGFQSPVQRDVFGCPSVR